MRYISMSLASALLATVFLGCGDSSSREDTTSLTKSSLISGIAVDDLIVNGDVVVYPAGEPSNILDRGKTTDTGSYAFAVKHDGVVVVKVTCGAGAQMKSPTGALRQCEQDLVLHSAAVVSPDISKVKVNVSALTDIVVQEMKDKGGSKEAFVKARNDVGVLFGFNPILKDPIKDPTYSKTVIAIRKLADQKKKTLSEVVQELHEDFSDGTMGDDGDISKELAVIMKDEGVVSVFTDNDGTVKIADKEIIPTKSDIQIAKEFFNELRTQAMSVVDYDNTGTDGFLDKEAKDLGDALEDIALNINIVGEYSTDILGDIMETIDHNETTHTSKIEDDSVAPIIDNKTEPTGTTGSADSKRARATGDIERTLTVTQTATPTVWSYSIAENGTEAYKGLMTLPSAKPKDIKLSSFTSLVAKLKGTLPLREMDSSKASGIQDVKMDMVLTKTAIGAELELKELSVKHGETSVVLSEVKGAVSYVYDDTKSGDDKLTMRFAQFDAGSIRGTVPGYQLDGSIKIPEYVLNSSIKDNNFSIENFSTHVNGSAFCLDAHNQRIEMTGGMVTYTDKSGADHLINIRSYGNFHTQIDGNVEGLKDGVSSIKNNPNNDAGPYGNYIGLKFDTVSIESASCKNIKIESLSINFENNQTDVYISSFCADGGYRRELTDTSGVFKDATGVSHKLTLEGNQLYTRFDGNAEGEERKDYKSVQFIHIIQQDNVSITSDSCVNPKLTYFNISLGGEGEKFYNSGKLPKKVSYSGSIKNTATKGEISGTLNVDWLNAATMDLTENADATALVDVSLAGKIKMPSRPEMLLNIGYKNPANKNNFTFGYAYASTTINGSGAFDKEMRNGTLVFTTHKGIVFNVIIKDKKVVYGAKSSVMRDGTKLGELQDREGVPVIKYTDGTFESLP